MVLYDPPAGRFVWPKLGLLGSAETRKIHASAILRQYGSSSYSSSPSSAPVREVRRREVFEEELVERRAGRQGCVDSMSHSWPGGTWWKQEWKRTEEEEEGGGGGRRRREMRGGPKYSWFTCYVVPVALLGSGLLGRGLPTLWTTTVSAGLTKDGGGSANAESLEEVLDILAEEGSDWIYGFFTFLYDVVSSPIERGEEEEEEGKEAAAVATRREEEGGATSSDDEEVKGVILDLQNQ
ncbi:aspartyl/asparaginyl beta-hydroxylase-like isoform X3 [Lates japonicus]|uniref:Aspartyl/asparaginyl beta-hydroxylase-like isoform X3 n=1 Tax=Lates japonicus TaxID=270547 RepID=A0AAD3MMY8_LATJO|nr:aspartyl/asparaginyl beta-hydroxylase-like isoform X3 [Lates japonicus]